MSVTTTRWTAFFDQLLSVSAFWNPQALSKARIDRKRLSDLSAEICEVASHLADLLEERSELSNSSGYRCSYIFHPVDAIEAAGGANGHFEGYVKGKLDALRGQYDFKYWPSMAELVRTIADDAESAEVEPSDSLTAVGSESSRTGLADTFKAFLVALDEVTKTNHGFLPDDFRLTDASLASLLSCTLGLGPDEVVDSAFVKRLRQRARESKCWQ